MLSKYSEKNTYGGYTWQIKIDSLFHAYIQEKGVNLFLVEFKEWKFLSYKIHFTFTSNCNFENTIVDLFEKIYKYFENQNDFIWTDLQKNRFLNNVLAEVNASSKPYFELETEKPPEQKRDSEKQTHKERVNKTFEAFTFPNILIEKRKAIENANASLGSFSLEKAIKFLEDFISNYGFDFDILIMLIGFTIMNRNREHSIKLFEQLNSKIEKNKSPLSKSQIKELYSLKRQYERMLME